MLQRAQALLPVRPPQRAFIEQYLANGFNGFRAAKAAGYKGSDDTLRSVASENLAKPNIAAAIEQRIKSMAMSADEALARLSAMARGDLGEFIDLSADDLKKHAQSFLLKKVRITSRIVPAEKEDDPPEIESRVELELYDAQAALGLILKEQHLKAGEPTDRLDVSDTKAEEARDKLERALARLAERNRAEDGAEQPDG